MMRRGQIHVNDNGRIALGKRDEGGIKIPLSRNQLQIDSIVPYLKESKLKDDLSKTG